MEYSKWFKMTEKGKIDRTWEEFRYFLQLQSAVDSSFMIFMARNEMI